MQPWHKLDLGQWLPYGTAKHRRNVGTAGGLDDECAKSAPGGGYADRRRDGRSPDPALAGDDQKALPDQLGWRSDSSSLCT